MSNIELLKQKDGFYSGIKNEQSKKSKAFNALRSIIMTSTLTDVTAGDAVFYVFDPPKKI